MRQSEEKKIITKTRSEREAKQSRTQTHACRHRPNSTHKKSLMYIYDSEQFVGISLCATFKCDGDQVIEMSEISS